VASTIIGSGEIPESGIPEFRLTDARPEPEAAAPVVEPDPEAAAPVVDEEAEIVEDEEERADRAVEPDPVLKAVESARPEIEAINARADIPIQAEAQAEAEIPALPEAPGRVRLHLFEGLRGRIRKVRR
jgi:hypothetical protein